MKTMFETDQPRKSAPGAFLNFELQTAPPTIDPIPGMQTLTFRGLPSLFHPCWYAENQLWYAEQSPIQNIGRTSWYKIPS